MKSNYVIARLRDQATTFSNRIGGSVDLETAFEQLDDLALPHAFVLGLIGEEAFESDVDGISAAGNAELQAVEITFSVVVAVANTNDGRGTDALGTLFDLRDELIAALLGWAPTPADGLPAPQEGRFAGIQYAGSAPIDSDRAVIFHRFDFKTTEHISAT